MPGTVDELLHLLDLEKIEDNLFRGGSPDTKRQRTFGGQVAAQAFMAAAHTVPEEYVAHSLHSYFLRPGDDQVPIVYDVDSLHDGRSFLTRRTLARQHGRPIYASTLSYQRAEDGWEHQDEMPEVPPPDDCPDMADLIKLANPEQGESWEKEWSALDIRLAGSSGGFRGLPELVDPESHPARTRLWMRISGSMPSDPRLHQAALVYASDLTLLAVTLVPHRKLISSPDVMPASLDHTVWFHRPMRADQWWLYDQISPSAQGGRGLALGRVFTQDGLLAASVAQEGMIRRRDPGRQ